CMEDDRQREQPPPSLHYRSKDDDGQTDMYTDRKDAFHDTERICNGGCPGNRFDRTGRKGIHDAAAAVDHKAENNGVQHAETQYNDSFDATVADTVGNR